MKKIIFLVFTIFILTLTACGKTEETEYPFAQLRPYENQLFNEGLLAVQSAVYDDNNNRIGDFWGYINEENDVIIDFQYDMATAFYMESAIVEDDELLYLINKEGEQISDAYGLMIRDYETGLVWFREARDKGLYGLMSADGEIIVEPTYENIIPTTVDGFLRPRYMAFKHGVAEVEVDGDSIFIDVEGNVVDQNYTGFNHHGHRLVIDGKDETRNVTVLDTEGNVVIDNIYAIELTLNGYIIVKDVDFEEETASIQFYGSDGQLVNDTIYQKIRPIVPNDLRNTIYIAWTDDNTKEAVTDEGIVIAERGEDVEFYDDYRFGGGKLILLRQYVNQNIELFDGENSSVITYNIIRGLSDKYIHVDDEQPKIIDYRNRVVHTFDINLINYIHFFDDGYSVFYGSYDDNGSLIAGLVIYNPETDTYIRPDKALHVNFNSEINVP